MGRCPTFEVTWPGGPPLALRLTEGLAISSTRAAATESTRRKTGHETGCQ